MTQPHPHTPAQNLRFALRVVWLLAKGFSAIFAGVLTLLLVAALFLPRFVDNERVKAALEAQLQTILRRPVVIGSVILTPQGVKLNGVRVAAADATGRDILESQSALVTLKLRPLLERRLELNQVKLVAPMIHVWRGADGAWNVADLFAPKQASQQPAGRFTLPVSLYADNTVIENGELDVDDALRGSRYAVKKFNLAVHKFDFEKPFTVSLRFQNHNRIGDRELDASVALDGSMSIANFDWQQAYLRAERLEVKVDGQAVRGTGGVAGFPLTTIDADLLAPAVGQAQWDAYLKKKLDLQLPPSRWKVKARFLEARKAHVDYLQVAAGPVSIRGTGLIDFSTGTPHVDADLFAAEFPLSAAPGFRQDLARFGLKGTASAEASVTARADRLIVHRARARWRDAGLTLKRATVTRGSLDLAVSNDFEKLDLTVAQGAVSAFSNAFSGIDLALDLKGRDLKVEHLALKWNDSRLRLKGRVVNLSNPKQVEIAGNADHVRWESAQALVSGIIASVSTRTAVAQDDDSPRKRWVQTFKYVIPRRFPDSVGHIRVAEVTHKNFSFKNTEIMWDLKGVTPTLQSAGGDVRIGFGPGRVEDIQAVQESNKFLRVVFLPYIYMHKMNSLSVLSAAQAYPKTLDFNRIEGQYSVERGVVSTRFFQVDSPQLVAYADGTADFGREQVDMGILTRLTSYRAPLPEWWVDELGRPAIGFRVKGDLNHPDLEPRLHKMESDEIEKVLNDGRSRAKARFETIEKLETP